MEQSKKTLDQLEKEKEMLQNLEKERDRLNSIREESGATQAVRRELEEGELSDSDEEIVLSDGKDSDFSPESPQCDPGENDTSSNPQSIIPLERIDTDGEARSTDGEAKSSDDEVEILAEKEKPKEFRKYWEDFEEDNESTEDEENENVEELQEENVKKSDNLKDMKNEAKITRVNPEKETPNENFWKAALLDIEKKVEDHDLFQRREDLNLMEETSKFFSRRTDILEEEDNHSYENSSERSSVDQDSMKKSGQYQNPPAKQELIPGFENSVKETLTKALQLIREKSGNVGPRVPGSEVSQGTSTSGGQGEGTKFVLDESWYKEKGFPKPSSLGSNSSHSLGLGSDQIQQRNVGNFHESGMHTRQHMSSLPDTLSFQGMQFGVSTSSGSSMQSRPFILSEQGMQAGSDMFSGQGMKSGSSMLSGQEMFSGSNMQARGMKSHGTMHSVGGLKSGGDMQSGIGKESVGGMQFRGGMQFGGSLQTVGGMQSGVGMQSGQFTPRTVSSILGSPPTLGYSSNHPQSTPTTLGYSSNHSQSTPTTLGYSSSHPQPTPPTLGYSSNHPQPTPSSAFLNSVLKVNYSHFLNLLNFFAKVWEFL